MTMTKRWAGLLLAAPLLAAAQSQSAMQAPPSMHGTAPPYVAQAEMPNTVAVLPAPPLPAMVPRAEDRPNASSSIHLDIAAGRESRPLDQVHH